MDKKLFSLFFLVLIISLFLFSYADVELVGNLTRERILEKCPSWKDEITSYSPNQKAIESREPDIL